MADVKLPGIGEVPKGALYAGLAAVAGLIILYSYSRKKAAATAAAAAAATPATTMVTDPAGNTCASLDPSSGYCPGTEEDEQYQEQLAASAGAYDEYDTGGNSTTTTTSTTAATATTNAQWAQEAETQLGNTAAVQAALGYILGGVPVTTAQQQIFQEAVGLVGPPPASYPAITLVGASDGTSIPPVLSSGQITGVSASDVTQGSALISWTPAAGAFSYELAIPGVPGSPWTTSGTSFDVGGLKPNTSYTVNVSAEPSGSGHGSATFKTT
jgi:hypothetical protein